MEIIDVASSGGGVPFSEFGGFDFVSFYFLAVQAVVGCKVCNVMIPNPVEPTCGAFAAIPCRLPTFISS
jgi:hypothetical protein